LRLGILTVLTISTIVSTRALEAETSALGNQVSETSISKDRSGQNLSDDPVMSQDDKWGWDLHEYKSVGPAYHLNHQVYILISKGTGSNGNVRCCEFQDSYIWNPLTGDRQHLDLNQRIIFENQHKSDVILSFLASFRGKSLESENRISTRYSPGFSPKCYINYGQYYVVTTPSGEKLRSFYVIMKLDRPEILTVSTCQSESVGAVRESITEFEKTPIIQIVPLEGGGAFLWSIDEGFLLRFDQFFQQHSTIHGRINVVDADDVNAQLELSPDGLDPKARTIIFANALKTQSKNDKKGDKNECVPSKYQTHWDQSGRTAGPACQ
jgi:hypothetical protein